ncbi:hypothetical protein K6L44_13325 [Gluconacetobacter entanii]|uniref:hypothetical protein n=1 Tax=Gluconacetobacter entanii TaxID=108528 RepID=UPI001C9343AD|nr:hypothetical protein [Gluconacetobacter entanii]MBY4640943.1 hypothetical protein [Gluconacetobacter entanii]MCW4579046.1 hypothetical protein [Gluconacetobacter entanii]MCW4582446.1 hypothetical protein [Gluconacetobacter entanii]MCW4585823.1 hypothetical protein [Gluconacetobacter entanii]
MTVNEMNNKPSSHTPSDWDIYRSQWDDLPLLSKGESKEIRIIDKNYVIVRMIPSLYSYTQNRSAMINGTDHIRLRIFEFIASLLRESGILVAAHAFGSDYYVTNRIYLHGTDCVPPIEVIVKGRHVGTPKHNLYRIQDYLDRSGDIIKPDTAHSPYVRFDYTNPLADSDGNRLRDECIPSGLAERFINTKAAEETAIFCFSLIYAFLSTRGIRLDDICLKIDSSGRVIFGEISPDCFRATYVGHAPDFQRASGTDKSKDTFRRGSAPEQVLESYRSFLKLITEPAIRAPISPFASF